MYIYSYIHIHIERERERELSWDLGFGATLELYRAMKVYHPAAPNNHNKRQSNGKENGKMKCKFRVEAVYRAQSLLRLRVPFLGRSLQ